MKTIVTEAFTTSEQVNDGRTLQDVLTHMITEVGELAQEIQLDAGKSNRLPSADGIVGEAIDVVACALDVIHLQSPSLTEEDLVAIIQLKLQKWKCMTTDITIYIASQSDDNFRLRYEATATLDDATLSIIQARLLKSFSLGREFPDARLEANILRKSKLMQTIFKDEFGLSTTIINLIV
jgi:hypothetical protein